MSATCDIKNTQASNVISKVRHGLLYTNANILKSSNGIYPIGWHIPLTTEYQTLYDYLATTQSSKVKEFGNKNWKYYPGITTTNSSKFTALGSGILQSAGVYVYKDEKLFLGCKEQIDNEWYAFKSSLQYDLAAFIQKASGTSIAISIRCIRDNSNGWTPSEKLVDYDGNIYDTIQIGTQIWMMQNLAVTHYNDGSDISGYYAYENDWSNVFYS
jgi:uncharacterized protein (TIGR02145 family)